MVEVGRSRERIERRGLKEAEWQSAEQIEVKGRDSQALALVVELFCGPKS